MTTARKDFGELIVFSKNSELALKLAKESKLLDKQLVQRITHIRYYSKEVAAFRKNLQISTGYFLPAWWQEERFKIDETEARKRAMGTKAKNKLKTNRQRLSKLPPLKKGPNTDASYRKAKPNKDEERNETKKLMDTYLHLDEPSSNALLSKLGIGQNSKQAPIDDNIKEGGWDRIAEFLANGDTVLVDRETPSPDGLNRTGTYSELVPIKREQHLHLQHEPSPDSQLSSLIDNDSNKAGLDGIDGGNQEMIQALSFERNASLTKSFAELVTTAPKLAPISTPSTSNQTDPGDEEDDDDIIIDSIRTSSRLERRLREMTEERFQRLLDDLDKLDISKWLPDYSLGYGTAPRNSLDEAMRRLARPKNDPLDADNLADLRELRSIADGRGLVGHRARVFLTRFFGRRFRALMERPNFGFKPNFVEKPFQQRFGARIGRLRMNFPTLHELAEQDEEESSIRRESTKLPFLPEPSTTRLLVKPHKTKKQQLQNVLVY